MHTDPTELKKLFMVEVLVLMARSILTVCH